MNTQPTTLPRHSCHKLGICQHPSTPCTGACQLPELIKMRRPSPLPTLAPGVLDGPYNQSHSPRHTLRYRQRRALLRFMVTVLAGLICTGVVAYVAL
ncbi:hypothetical protein [Rhodoferax sp.]|uniref:hypothetical protein n=1 Tax=Rhodoferax sp. TaxID=50421 RepID=UPI00261D66F1|nr:hypothetical protein [Rhodoferax sp.]MDD2811681.1 hypothetical protein [Rhodoferax sp.]MDD4942567.1 hypothetical protein [Rhodoferax sp.]